MPNVSNNTTAFLINSLSVGGAERVLVADINELYTRGYDVHMIMLFKSGPLKEELLLPADRLHVLDARSVFDISSWLRLRTLLSEKKIKTLLTTLNEANAVGRLVACTIPSLTLYTREANMSEAKGSVYKLLDWILGWRSCRIIVVSNAIRNSIIKYAPWLAGSMVRIYNGVEIPEAVPLHTPCPSMRLITVGSLTEKKDQQILLRALALLPSQFHLSLLGEGSLRRTLEALVVELGVSNRVQFLGNCAKHRVNAEYQKHDIFVLPSKYEGCPNVISEAQSFGLPVVAFDIPGMNEFISEDSGLLVKERTPEALADTLRDLGRSPERMKRLGAAGFDEVKRTRSKDIHIRALESLLVS